MAVIECPHCLTEVLPQLDGTCPSCQEDTTNATASEWCKIRVSPDTALPDMCCTCARQTERVEWVATRDHEATPGWARALLFLAFFLRGGFAWLKLPGLVQEDDVLFEVAMPRCEKCAEDGDLTPVHVNVEQQTMVFVVRRELRDLAAREL